MKTTTLIFLPHFLLSFQIVYCNLLRDVSTTVVSSSTSAFDTSSSSTFAPNSTQTNTLSSSNQINNTLPISTPVTFKPFTPSVFPSLAATTTTLVQPIVLSPTQSQEIAALQSVEAGSLISSSSSNERGFRVGGVAAPTPSPDVSGLDLEQGVQGPAVTETQSLRLFTPTTTVVDVPGTTAPVESGVATDTPTDGGNKEGSPTAVPAEGGDQVVPIISTTEGATLTRTVVFPPSSALPGEITEVTQSQPTTESASNSNIPAKNTNKNTETTQIKPAEPTPPSTTPTTLKTGTRPPITIIQLPPNPTNSDAVIVIDGISITLSNNSNGTTAVITPSIPRQTLPVLQVVSLISVSGRLNGGGNGTTIGGASATGRVKGPTVSVTGGNGNIGASAVPGGLLPDVDGPGSGGVRVVGMGMGMGIGWLLMFCVGGAFVWF